MIIDDHTAEILRAIAAGTLQVISTTMERVK